MDIYLKIKNTRSEMIAPVDVIGCYSVPNTVQDKKLYILISLIISAQTKDEINFQTMINLCTNLNINKKEISNLYKVRYKIIENILYLYINNKPYKYFKKDGTVIGPEIDLPCDRLSISNLTIETNLKDLLKPAGFFNKKYETVKGLVKFITKRGYPSTLAECLSIKGMGRKMSLLYLNRIKDYDNQFDDIKDYEQAVGISVDTHVHRLCNLLNIVKTTNPDATSNILESIIDRREWGEFNSVLVGYGQVLCKPLAPKCGECVVKDKCIKGSQYL